MVDEVSYRSLFDLTGRVALVTGANGILGRRYVQALAEFGAQVVVADMDASISEQHARDTQARFGAQCIGIGVDVSDPVQVEQMTGEIEARFGRIDVLLNNAASKGTDLAAFFAPTGEYALETWREIMAVNLDGLFLVAQAVGKEMVKQGRGSIINVSSIYGNVGPDQRIYEGAQYLDCAINTPAVYAASKAGVVGLTRYLAALWGSAGVRVNTLTPGGVESGQNEVFQERYGSRTPLGRMARGEEMAGAVVYLASDASSYVTGHNLMVDGGWSIW